MCIFESVNVFFVNNLFKTHETAKKKHTQMKT